MSTRLLPEAPLSFPLYILYIYWVNAAAATGHITPRSPAAACRSGAAPGTAPCTPTAFVIHRVCTATRQVCNSGQNQCASQGQVKVVLHDAWRTGSASRTRGRSRPAALGTACTCGHEQTLLQTCKLIKSRRQKAVQSACDMIGHTKLQAHGGTLTCSRRPSRSAGSTAGSAAPPSSFWLPTPSAWRPAEVIELVLLTVRPTPDFTDVHAFNRQLSGQAYSR